MNRRAIALALACAGCGAAAVPRAHVPVACVADEPEAPASLDATIAETLAALVHEHRPAGSSPATDASGVISVPIDWRSLPMTAELASFSHLGEHALAGDAVVTTEDGAVVARDARTGAERWRFTWTTPMPSELLVGCGRIVAVRQGAIVGVDPTTGAAVWTIPMVPAPSLSTPPGNIQMHGCHLAFQNSDAELAFASSFQSASLRVVDVATGTITLRATYDEPCVIRALTDDGLIVGSGEHTWLEPYAGEGRIALPARTSTLTAETTIAFGDDEIRAFSRASGALVWRRDIQSSSGFMRRAPAILARVSDDLVTRDGTALVRLSLVTGEERWRVPLSDELASGVAWSDGRASDAHRLVIGSRVEPQFLLDVDLDTGHARSLRISSIDPVALDLAGDLVLVSSHRARAIVDLSLDAPPMRERLALEDDVRRAIDTLGSTRPSDTIEGRPWLYPESRQDALEWLARLRPLVGDVVTPRLAHMPVADAADLLEALEGPAQTSSALDVLRRTYCLPDAAHVHARRRASDALRSPISEADAELLAQETIAWLEPLLDRPEMDEHGAIGDAVLASRDALLRTAPSASALDTIEEAVARRAPARVARDCTPSDDDAARAAALRYGYELSLAPGAEILVPGATCIRVQTLGGPLAVTDAEETDARPYVILGMPVPVEADDRRSLPFPDAPARRVSFTWYRDPLAAQGEDLWLQRIDGVWRVVFAQTLWVS